MLEGFRSMTRQQAGRWRIRNAFNPINWLTASTSAVLASALGAGAPAWAIAIVLITWIACVAVALIAYLRLLFKDPDRLQSEEFQIQRNYLQLTQGRGQLPFSEEEPLTLNPDVQTERAE